MKQIIDACGLSCPEPILKLKQGMGDSREIDLLVDNKTSVDACDRFARTKGMSVEVSESQGVFTLHLVKL